MAKKSKTAKRGGPARKKKRMKSEEEKEPGAQVCSARSAAGANGRLSLL